MWICLNDAFFSVVASDVEPDMLVVRARDKDHLKNWFPDKEIVELPNRDYQARVFVSRQEFDAFLLEASDSIDYFNFKDSVKEPKLKMIYSTAWSVFYDISLGLTEYLRRR